MSGLILGCKAGSGTICFLMIPHLCLLRAVDSRKYHGRTGGCGTTAEKRRRLRRCWRWLLGGGGAGRERENSTATVLLRHRWDGALRTETATAKSAASGHLLTPHTESGGGAPGSCCRPAWTTLRVLPVTGPQGNNKGGALRRFSSATMLLRYRGPVSWACVSFIIDIKYKKPTWLGCSTTRPRGR